MEFETYQDWLKEHFKKGGVYEQIVKACLDNIASGGFLKGVPSYFEIKKEK